MQIRCTKCGVEKPEDGFRPRSAKRNGRESVCRKCEAEAQNERQRRFKRKVIAYKGGMCQMCGLTDANPAVYQFHHRDPSEKEFSIYKRRCYTMNKLKPELDKCDLLCANCHAIVHSNY